MGAGVSLVKGGPLAIPLTQRQPPQPDRDRGQGKDLSAEYRRYIAGPIWKKRKKRYYSNHAKACTACGSETNIQLHHLSYKRMGEELDSDLMPLCDTHHKAVDDFRTPGMTIRDATRAMLFDVNPMYDDGTYVTVLPTSWGNPKQQRKKRKQEPGFFDRRSTAPARKQHQGQSPKRGVTGVDVLNRGNRRSLRTDNGL